MAVFFSPILISSSLLSVGVLFYVTLCCRKQRGSFNIIVGHITYLRILKKNKRGTQKLEGPPQGADREGKQCSSVNEHINS